MSEITLTEDAIERIKEIRLTKPEEVLQISIKGGGCQGLEYQLKTKEKEKNDIQINHGKNPLVTTDKNSFNLLKGCIIDFKKNISGGRFIIQNPNAKKTCSCGNSFNVESL